MIWTGLSKMGRRTDIHNAPSGDRTRPPHVDARKIDHRGIKRSRLRDAGEGRLAMAPRANQLVVVFGGNDE